MTWHAREIISPATPRAVARVQSDPALKPFSYVIRNLDDYPWHSPEHRHTVSDQGLLVIRPVFDEGRRQTPLNWQTLVRSDAMDNAPDPAVTKALRKYLDDNALDPPEAFRQFVRMLAVEMGNPVLYYCCSMSSGGVDFEYCLAYTPTERLLITPIDAPPTESDVGALNAGLELVDVHLPTAFYAPHTRDFPWDKYRL